MSDVLIKGMEMPKNCEGCRLIPGYCKHRNIYCMDDNQKKFIRPKDCPLIEVHTPHGRLIDADALKQKKKHSTEFAENVVSVAEIDWIPTIVEAEGIEDG